jgi:hypothetical protein
MGSGNMGATVKMHVADHFPCGKYNLFASFMVRALELLDFSGIWAFVSLRGFLTLEQYTELRELIGYSAPLALAADLGPGAFEAISGEVVTVGLFIGSRPRNGSYRCTFLDVRTEKDRQRALIERSCPVYEFTSEMLAAVPGRRYSYRLTQGQIELFRTCPSLRQYCFMTIGLITGHNQRFVRFAHEENRNSRWVGYLKTQSETAWSGEVNEVVDWEHEGARIRARYAEVGATGGKFNGAEFFLNPGLAATRVGGGALKARLFPSGLLFDSAASCGFAADRTTLLSVCGYLNSGLAQHYATELNGSFNYQAGDLNLLPMRSPTSLEAAAVAELVSTSVEAAQELVALSPTHFSFRPLVMRGGITSLLELVSDYVHFQQERCSVIAACTAELDRAVCS